MPNKYPIGLIVIIAITFIIGLFVLAISLVTALNHSLPQLYVFIFTIIALVYLGIGFGLLKFKRWARVITILFFGIAIFETLFFSFYLKKFTPLDITASLFKLALSLAVIVYLCKERVRALFR